MHIFTLSYPLFLIRKGPPHPNHRLPHFIGTHNGGNTFPSYTRGGSYDHGGRAHYRRSHNPPFPPPPPSNYPTGTYASRTSPK